MQKTIVKKSKQNTSIFRRELERFIEMVITVKGHAWCMDVEQERKKISKLLINELEDVI